MESSPLPIRLSSAPTEIIDRCKSLVFEFNGRSVHAYHGDTISSASGFTAAVSSTIALEGYYVLLAVARIA